MPTMPSHLSRRVSRPQDAFASQRSPLGSRRIRLGPLLAIVALLAPTAVSHAQGTAPPPIGEQAAPAPAQTAPAQPAPATAPVPPASAPAPAATAPVEPLGTPPPAGAVPATMTVPAAQPPIDEAQGSILATPEPEPAFYETWWFWTGVAAVAITTAIVLTTTAPQPPKTDLGNKTAY
jgi:hypothetical protein